MHHAQCIAFGPKECCSWTEIQNCALQNYNSGFAPVESVIFSNGQQESFDIDINLFTNFLYLS
jgi:hypothetical protein